MCDVWINIDLNELDCRELVRTRQLCLRRGAFHEQKKEIFEDEVSEFYVYSKAYLVVS